MDDIALSQRALKKLSSRGPDQWGDWADNDVYLGHCRLSIMDLSEKGRQPMLDHGIVITVNGEVYNFKALRAQLGNSPFKSKSDSEVLIHGYRKWGIDELLARIEGMYSFVLYDQKNKKLFLARDRVGIKPLYYSRVNEGFAWASELKAFTEFYKNTKLEVDKTALYDYLTYRYIPTPKSLYKNIYKLKPAHYLEFDISAHRLSEKRYWRLKVSQKTISLSKAASKVRYLIDKAVEQQLMSDVPIGFFLSGGMDSSAVVASAKKFSNHLNTYSIGFDVKEHDETHFAKLIADKFKTNHLRSEIAVKQVSKNFNKIRDWYDEPFADTSAFPVEKVSRLAKVSSTVVLTGDGGDEVFGGYNWYTQFRDGIKHYVKENSTQLQRITNKLIAKNRTLELEFEFYTKLMAGLTKKDKSRYRSLFDIPKHYDDYWYFRKFYRKDLPLFTRLQYMDFHTYLPDDILTKVDRVSMSVGLECRVPLLATDLIEFMFSVPEDIKYNNHELKGLMKYSLRNRLPSEILNRDKKGFSIPTGRWQKNLFKEDITVPEYILEKVFSDVMPKKNGGPF